MNKAKITNKSGFGVKNSVCFEMESSTEITPDQAKAAQTELGYMPAGYGFEGFRVERDAVLLRYKATWKCQASCD